MRCVILLALVGAAASARVQSTEFTYLGDILPTRRSVGYPPFQLNEQRYADGFAQYVLNAQGDKVVKQFTHGVHTHAPARVHYHIEGKYSKFAGCVGLNAYWGNGRDCSQHDGVMFTVKADGKAIWSIKKNMGETRTCFSVALEVIDPSRNAQTLELVVDKLENNHCDKAEWTDTKLYEDPIVDCQQLGSLAPSYHSIGWGSYWVNHRWHHHGMQIAGARYSSGVFAHAPSKVIYPLHSKFDTFSSCVGLDDGTKGKESKDCGEVAFKVFVDGAQKVLVNATQAKQIVMKGMEPVKCFAVGVTNAHTLTLVVDHMQDSTCDESEWVNANVCRETPTKKDCTVNLWAGYTQCSKTCGTGYKTRYRTVNQTRQWGGKACPQRSQTVKCNDHACPIDCIESRWSDWVRCSRTCGGGYQFRYRSEDRSAAYGGVQCGDLSQKKVCGQTKCPVDCQVSDWTNWDDCDKKCGGGLQWQRRTILVDQDGGTACPVLKQKRGCNDQPCSIDCAMNDFGDWSGCSVECGGGNQFRTRSVHRRDQHGGKGCPAAREDRACNIGECPINCKLSDWGEWPFCSSTCGGGHRTRYRSIEITSAYGGTPCGNLTHTEPCNSDPCPTDCRMGPWGPYQGCDASCGGGTQHRFRNVEQDVLNGGKACSARSELRPCNVWTCPIDCVDHKFGKWSPCTKSCKKGSQTRHRTITPASFGGDECAADLKMFETQDCNDFPCAKNCDQTDWTLWSECSETCWDGASNLTMGTSFRTRSTKSGPLNGGKACGSLREEKTCNTHPCPTNCNHTAWTLWTKCSKSCNEGIQTRERVVTKKAAHGGTCGATQETRSCGHDKCAQDCLLANWTVSGTCNVPCATKEEMGSITRRRSVLLPPKYGGKGCGVRVETKPCPWTGGVKWCKIDCKWGMWEKWGNCSQACGGGTQQRTRKEAVTKAHGGAACVGDAVETRPCGKGHCPPTCKLSDWADWGKCSRSCGEGIRKRTRTSTAQFTRCYESKAIFDKYDGKQGLVDGKYRLSGDATCSGTEYAYKYNMNGYCPPSLHVTTCNKDVKCPQDCILHSWNSWARCSKSCGDGFTFRDRNPIQIALNGGEACGKMREVKFCNQIDCNHHTLQKWEPVNTTTTAAPKNINLSKRRVVTRVQDRTTTTTTTTPWTLPPTPSPVQPRQSCKNGNATVPDGWAGAGYGKYFCNLVTCDDGTLSGLTRKDCVAFHHKGTKCDSIDCDYVFNATSNRYLVHVTHKNGNGFSAATYASEASGRHHCAYNSNAPGGDCECRCFFSDAKVDSVAGRPVVLQWSQE